MNFALDAIDTLTGSCAGAPMTVLDLTGRPLLNSKGQPHIITLLGPDSPQYQSALHAQTVRRVAAASKAAADAKDGASHVADPAEAKADSIEVMARCSKAWDGFLDRDGNPIPCDADAARTLYTKFPVIYDQVDAFIARRVNFLPVSPKA